jgi:hypothetical protein
MLKSAISSSKRKNEKKMIFYIIKYRILPK